ncbi:MAG TPA: choice-of-anchor B family protein [Ignavibacteria bacterium]|nr:choice-of-anchor B family protein [Ignavibacteria bacterium]HMR39985.1 choice-of-anchor B family protein [Ignavibacteria bacterium]
MKKIFLSAFILIVIITSGRSFAQLPNQNMYLLRNVNEHFTSTLYSAIWGYAAPDGREYAILGCPTGTAFIDVTDSADIHEVDYLPGLTSSWREMKTYSHYAYIVSEATNSKLQIVDLQYLPDSVHLVQTWGYTGYTRTHSISQAGNYLYLNGGNASSNGGIQILDVSDPENPVKLGTWTTLYVHDCRVDNDTIYAANINNGKVSIINATNKSALSTVTTFNNLVGAGPHNTALSQDKKRLFVTDEIGNAPYLLKVWNITDRSNPVFVTSWQPTGITSSIVHNIETYGNYGVIAHYSAGVRVINIADPDNPTEIAWYDTYPSNNSESYNGCWGVYMLPSGKIIASDRQTGLYVLKTNFPLTGISNEVSNIAPENYTLEQNFPNPFNPSTVIKYQIPASDFVSLKVYNEAGKEVADLVNENQTPGTYEINFDGSKLSSGIYFYSIKAGEFNTTKKMLLIK